MSNQVIFTVRTRDQASPKLDAVSQKVKTLGDVAKMTSRKFNSSMLSMGRSMEKMGSRMRAVGTNMSIGLSLPIGLAVRAGIKAFSDLDHAMTNSLAIMGDVSDEMRKDMTELAKTLSMELPISADKLAESYYFLASAGMDAAQSMAALPAVAEFATAGNFDMAQATDLLTDALSALGMASKDPEENLKNLTFLSDAFVKANTLANASVQQFSEALTNEAGVAMRQYNIELEEGLAVLATFADQGIKGNIAGSLFGRSMRLLAKAVGENGDAFQKMGIKIYDAEGNFNDFADIAEDLENAFKGMSVEQRTAALEMLGFQAKTQQAILPLIGMSEKIREYKEALGDAGGATKEVAEKQLKSFKNQMELTKNSLTLLAGEFAETLAPMMLELTKKIRKLVGWFRNLSPRIKKIISLSAILVAALGPLLMIFGSIASGVGGMITMFAKLGTVIGPLLSKLPALGTAIRALMGPVGWVLAAVGVLAVAWKKNWFGMQDATKEAWEKIKTKTKAGYEAIKSVIKTGQEWKKDYLAMSSAEQLEVRKLAGKQALKLTVAFAKDSIGLWVALGKDLMKIAFNLWKVLGRVWWEGMKNFGEILVSIDWTKVANIWAKGLGFSVRAIGLGFKAILQIAVGFRKDLAVRIAATVVKIFRVWDKFKEKFLAWWKEFKIIPAITNFFARIGQAMWEQSQKVGKWIGNVAKSFMDGLLGKKVVIPKPDIKKVEEGMGEAKDKYEQFMGEVYDIIDNPGDAEFTHTKAALGKVGEEFKAFAGEIGDEMQKDLSGGIFKDGINLDLKGDFERIKKTALEAGLGFENTSRQMENGFKATRAQIALTKKEMDKLLFKGYKKRKNPELTHMLTQLKDNGASKKAIDRLYEQLENAKNRGDVVRIAGFVEEIKKAQSKSLEKIKEENIKDTEDFIAFTDDMKTKTDEAMSGISESVGGMGDTYAKEMEKAVKSMDKLEKAHEKNTAKIGTKISELKTKLRELTASYKESLQGFDNSLGGKVVEQQAKIKEMQKQLKEGGGEMKDRTALMEQLTREKLALESFMKTHKDLDDEIKEAQRRSRLTDFERFVEDVEAKKVIKSKEFEEQKLLLEKQVKEQESAMEKERKIFDEKRKLYKSNILAFNKMTEGMVQGYEKVRAVSQTAIKQPESDGQDGGGMNMGKSNDAMRDFASVHRETENEILALRLSNEATLMESFLGGIEARGIARTAEYTEMFDWIKKEVEEHDAAFQLERDIFDKKQRMYLDTLKVFMQMVDGMIRGYDILLVKTQKTVDEMAKKLQELKRILQEIKALTAPSDGPDNRTLADVGHQFGAVDPTGGGVFNTSRYVTENSGGNVTSGDTNYNFSFTGDLGTSEGRQDLIDSITREINVGSQF